MIEISRKLGSDIHDWATSKCSALKVISPDFRAIGIERDGVLGAAVFYDDFRRGDCNISVLIEDRRVVTRCMLHRVFVMPFCDWGKHRVSAVANSFNSASISLIERLGFAREGVRRQVYDNGADEVVFGMLRQDCRWLTLQERFFDPHTAGAF